MTHQGQVLRAVRAAFEREPRINLHKYPVRMDFSEGVLTLEGEVEDVAAKKLSLELAIAVPGVTGIVDRLHVTPSTHMGDGAILDAVRDALLHAPGLQNCTIQVKRKGTWETVREATVAPHGVIQLSVTDGGSCSWMIMSPASFRSGWPACWPGGSPGVETSSMAWRSPRCRKIPMRKLRKRCASCWERIPSSTASASV